MSLAEDLPRSYLGSLSRPGSAKLSRVSLADLALRTVPSRADRAAPGRAEPPPARPAAPVAPDADEAEAVVSLPRRNERQPSSGRDTSLDLLDRASKGMAAILTRYKQLEEHVAQVDSWSNAQIQAAEAEATRWQEVAAAAERRLEECQRSLEIMVRRVEAAEQAMHRDKETLTVLQDRIIDAFGFGSDAHEAIAAGLQID